MDPTSKHLLIQAGLLCLLLILLTFTKLELKSKAQSSCVQPQLMHGDFVFWDSWPKGTNVTVRIDDTWSATERGFFEQGIRKWNGVPPLPANCSLVTFSGFSSHRFSSYTASPPDNTADWMRTTPGNSFNGEVLYHYIDEVNFRIRAVRHLIRPVPNVVENSYFVYLGTHETGHTFDLADCLSTNGCPTGGLSIMSGHTNDPAFNTGGPTSCDHAAVNKIYCPSPTPTPTPTPSPTPPQTEEDCQNSGGSWNSFTSSCEPGGWVGPCPDTCIPQVFNEPSEGNSCLGPATDYCLYPLSGCEPGRTNSGGNCCCSYASTPVLIDLGGNGFSLTDANGGVDFDINGDGVKERLAWTSAGSDDAWLVLDHSNNGRIDNGRELFGNYTPQLRPPPGVPANGFLALAAYDKTMYGGNADGVITQADAVFSRLRLWRDANHDGIAENFELHPLVSSGVAVLEFDYKESKRTDEHGNQFRFRAKVQNAQGQQMGRWAWDVFLVKAR